MKRMGYGRESFPLALVSGCSMLSRACWRLDIEVVIQWSHEQEKGKGLMNQELRDLFVADQSERRGDIGYDTPDYWQMRERDAQRRQRVSELLAQGGVSAPD